MKRMKLLVLGGTQFVGRAVAEAALERGHGLALFNRGRTNPGLFPQAEHLLGDRAGDLSALKGRSFDAVIDVNGYDPEVVGAAVDSIDARHYVFVSTISVYSDFSSPNDENSPVDETGDGYGGLKVACERVLPPHALVVRPCIVAGPHDPTYRFTYWVDRIARGGDVVAPEPRDGRVQLIDARDLGEWIVRATESGRAGVFNAAGPAAPLTMEQLLEAIRGATGSDARLRWVVPRGIEDYLLPFWTDDPDWTAHGQVDNSRAIAAGLTFRPPEETAHDTLEWVRSGAELFVDRGHPKPGLDPQLETELTAA
jgi:2'-hydroxyisoflavone reductase